MEASQRAYLGKTSPEDRIRRIHRMAGASYVVQLAAAAGLAITVWVKNPGGVASWIVVGIVVVGLAALFIYAHRRMRVIEGRIRSGEA